MVAIDSTVYHRAELGFYFITGECCNQKLHRVDGNRQLFYFIACVRAPLS